MRANYLRACAAAAGACLLSLTIAVYSAVAFDPSQQPFGYAPSVAVSGFDVSRGDQQVFQTWFENTYWRGDLVAYQLDETGNTDDNSRLWFASEKLAAQNHDTGRRIVTRNGNNNVPFRWGDLSAAQQSSLGDNATGPKVLNFVRGDRTNEKQFIEVEGDGTVVILSGSATGIFRARGSILGDIVHGKPVYVGKPVAGYNFNQYGAFKTANKDRAGVVYVGANDGMLHAFEAATGREIFAYVPSMLVPALKALSTDPYTHQYYVDGPLTVGDVTPTAASTAWKTVLVGGLGAGGKGLFALDVTSAAAADETAAKSKILWEITPASTGFADLGHTYSAPAIVRLNDGRWAAVVGNGYNNTGSGRAVLYVIDATTGALIRALDTGSGGAGSPNGLSSPTAVDQNFDGKADYIYAGDINGNLWKFDLSSPSSGSWTSTMLFNGTGTARPIIGAPDVADHPLGGLIVYFATGDLFTQGRANDKLVQNYVYGIWDGAPAANKTLLDQTLKEAVHGARRVRVSSANAINWDNSSDPNDKKLHNGWRMILPPGEHVVGSGFIRDGRYHFTSTNPAVDNPAPPDGENWLMELDYLNGATTGMLVFDLDSDQQLTSGDRVKAANGATVMTNSGIPVGIYLGAGLYSQPVMVLIDQKFSTTLFNRIPSASPADIPSDPGTPPTTTTGGVEKGHFDLDAYHGVNTGSFKHVHEYDDKYDVVGANFLNASDPIFNLGNPVNGNRVTAASEFFILVANGDMSPGVTLTIANQDHKVYEFANKFDGTQKTYTLATVGLFQFKMPVDAFEPRDWGTGLVRPGLIPSVTGCVKSNAPGQFGEIHAGALTIQIVKKGAPASAIQLNVPGKPEKGYKVVDDAWLLKKYTVFWHHGQCYGQNGWVMAPTPVYHANTGQVAGAPGSADPKSGDLPNLGPPLTPIGTTSVFTPAPGNTSGTNGKAGTKVITTNYSDGSKDVITEVYDKKGRLASRTTVRVKPGTPGTAGTDNGSTQPVYFDPLTAPPQSRSGAKVGRIGWHELIKN